MADSANTYQSLLPLMKNAYADKVKKLSEKPSNKRYFSFLKKSLKKTK